MQRTVRADEYTVVLHTVDYDNIGRHTLGFKSTKMGSRATKSHLDLIGDTEAVDGPNMGKGRLEMTLGQGHLAAARPT